MPLITEALLKSLLEAAGQDSGDCIVPVTPGGRLQPLCALYRRRCLNTVSGRLGRGVRKMREAIPQLSAILLPAPTAAPFRNLNTPQEWDAHRTVSTEP
jgi:molybdopterin-guanine dinucleotide biosynthesis protein A